MPAAPTTSDVDSFIAQHAAASTPAPTPTPTPAAPSVDSFIQQHVQQTPDYVRTMQANAGTHPDFQCGQAVSNALKAHGYMHSVTDMLNDPSLRTAVQPDAHGNYPAGTIVYFPKGGRSSQQHFAVVGTGNTVVENTSEGTGQYTYTGGRTVQQIAAEHGGRVQAWLPRQAPASSASVDSFIQQHAASQRPSATGTVPDPAGTNMPMVPQPRYKGNTGPGPAANPFRPASAPQLSNADRAFSNVAAYMHPDDGFNVGRGHGPDAPTLPPISDQAMSQGGAGLPGTPLHNDYSHHGGIVTRRYAPGFGGSLVVYGDGSVGKYDAHGQRISLTAGAGAAQAAGAARIASAQRAPLPDPSSGHLINDALGEGAANFARVGSAVGGTLMQSPVTDIIAGRFGQPHLTRRVGEMAGGGIAQTPFAAADVIHGAGSGAAHVAAGTNYVGGVAAAKLFRNPKLAQHYAALAQQAFENSDNETGQTAVDALGNLPFGSTLLAAMKAKANGQPIAPAVLADLKNLPQTILNAAGLLGGLHGATKGALPPVEVRIPELTPDHPLAALTGEQAPTRAVQVPAIQHTGFQPRIDPTAAPLGRADMLAEMDRTVTSPAGKRILAKVKAQPDVAPPGPVEPVPPLTPAEMADPRFADIAATTPPARTMRPVQGPPHRGADTHPPTPAEALPNALEASLKARGVEPPPTVAPLQPEQRGTTTPSPEPGTPNTPTSPNPRVNSIHVPNLTANMPPEAAAGVQAQADALKPLPRHTWEADRQTATTAGPVLDQMLRTPVGTLPPRPEGIPELDWPMHVTRQAGNLYAYLRGEGVRLRNENAASPTAAGQAAIDANMAAQTHMMQSRQALVNHYGVGLNSLADSPIPTTTDQIREQAQRVPSLDVLKPQATPVRQNPAARKWGAANKGVTLGEADAIRQRMKDRLAAGTQGGVKGLASRAIHDETGAVDADLIPDLVKLGQFHIEAGARSFAEWGARMAQDAPGLTQQDQQDLWNKSRTALAADIKQRQSEASQAAWTQPLAKSMGFSRAQSFINNIADAHDALWNDKPLMPHQQAEIARQYNDNVPVRFRGKPNAVVARIRGIVHDAKAGRINYDDPVDIVRQHLLTTLGDPDKQQAASKELDAAPRDAEGNLTAKGLHQVTETINKYAGQSYVDNIEHYIRANLLSGPATLAKIALSHILSVATEDLLVRPVARTVPRLAAHVAPLDVGASFRAAKRGFAAAKDVPTLMGGGENMVRLGGNAPYLDPAHPFRPEFTVGKGGPVSRAVNAAVRTPMRVHSALYHMIGSAIYDRGLQEGAWAEARRELSADGKPSDAAIRSRAKELYTSPTPDVMDIARQHYQEQMFLNSNGASTAIKNVAGKNPIKRTVASTLVPFAKVPSNIAGRQFEYNPIGGAISAAKLMLETKNAKMTPREVDALKGNAARALGRGLVGSALTALGYELWRSHNAQGQNDAEYQPGSVRAGNRMVDVSGMGPTATPLILGATLGQRAEDAATNNQPQSWRDIAQSYFQDQPLVRQGASIFAPRGNQDKAVAAGAAGVTQEFAPFSVGFKQTAAATDPTHSVRSKKGYLDYLRNGYPGAREGLPLAHDRFGRTVPEPGGFGLRSVPVGSRGDALEEAINRASPSSNRTYTPEEDARYQEKQALLPMIKALGGKPIPPGSDLDKRMQDDLAKGRLAQGDPRYLQEDATQPPIVGKVAGLHVEDQIRLFRDKANDTEKRQLAPMLIQSIRRRRMSMTSQDMQKAFGLVSPYLPKN